MLEKKNTILIVDDEEEIRKMLTIFLDAADFKVCECDSGKQALRLSASVRPDLILLDLGLPDIDGKEVIKGIREWSQVPIIVCSVRNSDEEIIKALDRDRLTVRAAHARTGIAAADFSRIRNADLGRFTVDRLMSILNRLGSRVEVKVRVRRAERRAEPVGRAASA